MTNTNTSVEVPGPVENGPELSPTLTPIVLEELKGAFSEQTEPTVHEKEVDELREVFEADQEEAAQLEEALATVEPVADEVSEKTVKPRFGSRRPERKPTIDLLDTNTRVGRFVSKVVFGEMGSSQNNKVNQFTALAEQKRKADIVSVRAGGGLSPRALQNLKDKN